MKWKTIITVFLIAAILVLSNSSKSSAYICGDYVSADVDGDGVIRLADALLVMRYFFVTHTLTQNQLCACNVNGDFIVIQPYDFGFTQAKCDLSDFIIILRKAYGLIP